MKTIERVIIGVVLVAVVGFLSILLVRACSDPRREESTPITADVR